MTRVEEVHDGPVDRAAVDRLKELYVDGDLSLEDLEDAASAVFGGDPGALGVAGTCLVCGGDTTGTSRYMTLKDVRCPACKRPRDRGDVPGCVL